MAAFGSGINPSLGATNYGGFLQGALQGAQSAARGNEMVAQGIQQAGQQISALAQQYMQKKEKRELEEQAISAFQNIAQANPGLAKELGVNAGDRSAIKYVVNGIGAEKALGLAGALQQQKQQSKLFGLQTQAAQSKIDNESALAKALSMNIDTDGKVDKQGVLSSFVELGGTDLSAYSALAKQLEGGFSPEARKIDTGNGGSVTVVQTSPNQYQVLQEKSDKDVAGVQEAKFRAQAVADAQQAYKAGDIESAIAHAYSAGLRGQLGSAITVDELPAILGVEPIVPVEQGEPKKETAQKPAEKTVNGIVLVKNADGSWVKKK